MAWCSCFMGRLMKPMALESGPWQEALNGLGSHRLWSETPANSCIHLELEDVDWVGLAHKQT